jgi:putative Holliday junction resolvase
MRILGIDMGQRRVGLAISDPSGTLARPLMTLHVTSAADAVNRTAAEVTRLAAEDDGLGAIVVGMPARLDGSPTTATPAAIEFVSALRQRTPVLVVTEGERLTSREAESQLAVRERDWRKRKEQLDAVAAAIILQDYLDRRPT